MLNDAILKDPNALMLLRFLAFSQHGEIREERTVDVRLRYPEVEETLALTPEAVLSTIEKLVHAGLLVKRPYSNELCCSRCGSMNIYMELFCIKCGSMNLDKNLLIRHYECGYIGAEHEFNRGDKYVCPKCLKPLKQIGVDYCKEGIAYECSDCGEKFLEPIEKWYCQDCKYTFETKEALLKNLFTYKLPSSVKVKVSAILFDMSPLVERFKQAGFNVEAPATIRGISGLTHYLDVLAVKKLDKGVKTVGVRLITSESEVSIHDVYSFYSEARDSKLSEAVVLALPKASKEVRVFTEAYGLKLIEVKDQNELIKKLDQVLEPKHLK
ncbi:MAG: hypothetical protein QXK12_04610 [Candidatus Nezhaarchaeales archaeon]